MKLEETVSILDGKIRTQKGLDRMRDRLNLMTGDTTGRNVRSSHYQLPKYYIEEMRLSETQLK